MSAAPETLEAVLADIIRRWTGAVKDRHSALHTPVVSSVIDGCPASRIMVLRAATADGTAFRFHTDARSPKAHAINNGAPVSLLGYDAQARLQLIVRGKGRVETESAATDAAWQASALSSRRCYLAAHAPGTEVDDAISGLPDHLLARAPTADESEAGRANFAILQIEASELEWLLLTSCGNKRAVFHYVNEKWQGQWITP